MLKNFVLNLDVIEMKIEIIYSIWRSGHDKRLYCSFSIFYFGYTLSSLDYFDITL